ncbi:hypothetical protein VNO77_48780 [Canavalia gladiata]|uniref:Uncharacterized protein n=1 Tax=Canavalia gladiata TaxID=3824 RepID=A0AAN9PGY7_CANGL
MFVARCNKIKLVRGIYIFIILMCLNVPHNPKEFRGRGLFIFRFRIKKLQEMRELRIPTRNTNPIHNDVPENTTFLLLDQPSGEANTTGTLINKINEVAINAKTANWKAIVMLLILQFTNKRTIPFDRAPSLDSFIDKKFIM